MHEATTATSDALYRLPRTVVPRRYDLRIEPDLDAARFTGTEDVAVEVVSATSEVVLNANDLAITEAWLVGPGAERVEATTSHDADTERLTLHAAAELVPGEWTVHLGFAGEINDKLKGFYRSIFTDASGIARVIGTTQMEPTHARLAFPCWDEPDLKAVFAVTLVVADELLAVSNAAEVGRETLADGRVAVRFADTIPMSTYLVAWVVGPLVATAPVDVDGVPLRVVHVPGKEALTPFALEVGAFALRLFSNYYGIPYPGDKCDLIALPDFAAGAMENLGAITFREAVLLVDPAEATRAEQQRVADVISHELAHMWFGDLVTMKWWNGLWLNEAFATFMEVAAVDAFRPDWSRWVAFSNERAGAFAIDALASTRPIEYPVHSPQDAEGMFDLLTYEKGASVLRMLEQYLGEARFRAGIRAYLEAHEYGNAETTDLWDAIEETSGEPVRRIMDTWIFQGGHPLIGVEADGDTVTLTQRRFRFLPDDGDAVGSDGTSRAIWAVPLIVSANGTTHKVLLDTPSTTVDVPGASGGIVVNAGGHGFYRVRYSPALLAGLWARIDTLEPVERALLVDDSWAATLAAETDAREFLDLARAYGAETDPAVWTALSGALGGIERILDGTARDRFHAYVGEVAGPALARLGWAPTAGDDDLARETRKIVLTLLGGLAGDTATVARARDLLEVELTSGPTTDPDVAAAVVSIVASNGTPEEWGRYLDRYRSAPTPQEQLRYQYALAQFPQADLATRTLQLCMTEFRSQNAPFVILYLLGNREVNTEAWEFVKREWGAINDRFPDNAIPRLLGGITALSTPELAADVEAFLATHPVPQATKTVEQHLERLRVNVALRQRESARLAAFLG